MSNVTSTRSKRRQPALTLATILAGVSATLLLSLARSAHAQHPPREPASAEAFAARNPYAPLSPQLLFPSPTPTFIVAGDTSCALDQQAHLSCTGPGVTELPSATPIAIIAAGAKHICALDITGSVHCVGDRSHHQLALPADTYVDLALGEHFSCALTSGSRVRCAGTHAQGPMTSPAGSFRQLVATDQQACALRQSGQIHCWGAAPSVPLPLPEGRFVNLVTAHQRICAQKPDGTSLCWGTPATRTP